MKKNFKKVIAAALTAVMVAALFAGCGSGSSDKKEEQASSAAAVSESSAPAAASSASEASSVAEETDKPYAGQKVRVLLNAHPWQEAIEPIVSEFEEKTGIDVEITVLGEDAYWDRVNLGISSEEPPFDVFMLSPNMTGYNGYVNGWIANLDDYVYADPSYDFDDIYPYIVDGFRFPDADGSIYGIPLTMETYMLFYRKDLFAEQNIDVSKLETIDDWMAALDTIKAAYPDIAPAVIRGQDATMPDELLAAVYNNWGDRPYLAQRMFYFDEDWNTQFTDPAVKAGFETWAKLLAMGPVGATSFTWYECVNQFAAGKAATYWFDASVFASTFEDPEQSQVVGKVGYAAIPKTATGNGTTHWAWGLGITEKSPVKDAAFEFIKWGTSKEMNIYTATGTYGPVRASAWEAKSAEFGEEFCNAVDTSLNMSAPGYMYFNGAGEVTDKIIDAVVRISQGEDLDTVMEWMDQQAKEIVEKEGLKNQ